MRRPVLMIACALSLMLGTAAVLVWFLSFLAFAPFGQFWTTSWDGNGSGYLGRGWIALNGSFHLLREDRTMQPAPTSVANRYRHSGIDPIPGVHPKQTTLGFAYVSRVTVWRDPGNGRRVTSTTQQLSFPIWLLAIVLAVLPIGWSVTAMRQRRLRVRGLCPSCGYDLRATRDRCPECGTPVPQKSEVATASARQGSTSG